MVKKTVFFLLFAVLSTQVASQPPTELPKQIGPPSDPVWVSASLAVVDGRLQPDYFNDSQFEWLSAALANAASRIKKDGPQDCAWQLKRRIDSYPAPPDSLRKLVVSAKTNALAVVEEVDSGFWLGHPSTLLRLGISETTGPGGPTTGSVLVVLLQGNVETKDGRLCGNFSNRPMPEVGDRIRILSIGKDKWSEKEPSLLFPDEYFFVGPKASVPPARYAQELGTEPEAYLNSLLEEADLLRSQGRLP